MSLHPGVVVGVFVLVVLTVALALSALLIVWRNGYVRGWRAAGRQEPRCPECGYDLTGLRRCLCPECGHQPTLEQIARTVRVPMPFSRATDHG